MSDAQGSPAEGDRPAGPEQVSPEQLRALFHRKTLAGERHRAAAARLLEMDDTEAAALAHLAQHGQLTPGELGSLVGLTSGGTTALINRLLESGRLTRHPHPRDRRSSILTASPAVLERASELYAPLVSDMNELAESLTAEERAMIGRYLADVVELFERHASRLLDLVRAEEREVVSPPAPGLWT
jgi:DNA-binding MarR family transcriptional regulator